MRCDHCPLCRKSDMCTPGRHICLVRKQAERDLMPIRWKPAERK